MSYVLMVTWDGGGNVPPMMRIAESLKARGHDVRFLGHEAQRAGITDAGFGFAGYQHATPWVARGPREPMAPFETFVDGGAGRDLEAILAEERPDAIVVDCLMLGPLQVAEASGVPTVVLIHSFYAFFGEAFLHSPITEMGAQHGRDPRTLWDAADRVLVTTDRDLDPTTEAIPANVHWTGVAQAAVSPAPRADPARVLLSLSTLWFEGQHESMQRILDALGDLPVEVIATAGEQVAADSLRVPANVQVRSFVPHAELMPTVSMVIGHGGHATTMLALAHDLPLLVVPQFPIDQPMMGQVLGAHGAGRMVEQHASTEQLREAITALLSDDRYRRAAASIGARLREQDGAGCAADEIESLIETRMGPDLVQRSARAAEPSSTISVGAPGVPLSR